MISFRESLDPASQAHKARERISSRASDNKITRFGRLERGELNQWWKNTEKSKQPKVKFKPHRIAGKKVAPKPADGNEPKTDTDPKPQFSQPSTAQDRLRTAARNKLDPEARAKAEADRAAYAASNRKRFGGIIQATSGTTETKTASDKMKETLANNIAQKKKSFHNLLGT